VPDIVLVERVLSTMRYANCVDRYVGQRWHSKKASGTRDDAPLREPKSRRGYRSRYHQRRLASAPVRSSRIQRLDCTFTRTIVRCGDAADNGKGAMVSRTATDRSGEDAIRRPRNAQACLVHRASSCAKCRAPSCWGNSGSSSSIAHCLMFRQFCGQWNSSGPATAYTAASQCSSTNRGEASS
jgi:hypothetical protein